MKVLTVLIWLSFICNVIYTSGFTGEHDLLSHRSISNQCLNNELIGTYWLGLTEQCWVDPSAEGQMCVEALSLSVWVLVKSEQNTHIYQHTLNAAAAFRASLNTGTCVYVDSLSCRPLQESLQGDDQLTQKPLDDRSALGELILHLDLQDVSHQSHKGVFLHEERNEKEFYFHHYKHFVVSLLLLLLNFQSFIMRKSWHKHCTLHWIKKIMLTSTTLLCVVAVIWCFYHENSLWWCRLLRY